MYKQELIFIGNSVQYVKGDIFRVNIFCTENTNILIELFGYPH